MTKATGDASVELVSSRFLSALWGGSFQVQVARGAALRRGAFDGRNQVVPAPGTELGALSLLRARAAHAAAHARYSGERRPKGSLRPLQRVLVSLFEDARVEALSLRHFPGLRRLWAPFHTASALEGSSAVALFARLARALFEPGYADPSSWVQKARELFFADESAWASAELSRRLGSVLGNELGQMRAAFDARQYVAEPIYRDDHSGLWEAEPSSVSETPRASGTLASGSEGVHADDPTVLEPAASGDTPTLAYPEWDYVIARERAAFCELREQVAIRTAEPVATESSRRVAARVAAALSRAHRATRLQRRSSDGPWLDLSALVDAAAEQHLRRSSALRVYARLRRTRRRSCSLLLLDCSESLDERALSQARELSRLLGLASSTHRELAIHGFASFGCRDVRFARFKAFDEPASIANERLAGLRAAGSTRLGCALRHSVSLLRARPLSPKLLLVVTDGEPSDIDVHDPRYLLEDAREAVRLARASGLHVVGICIGHGSRAAQRRLFGPDCFRLERLAALPHLLSRAYARALGGHR